jgi:hypothetical protein
MMPAAFLDGGLADYLVWIFRIIAALGGAVIGYLLSGPVVRLLYRGAFHRPAPIGAVFTGKICGAGLLGCLFFFLVGLGGNFGFGPGGGGGGTGNGNGDGKGGATADKSGDKRTGDKKDGSSQKLRTILDIELLGGKRYKDDGRFFLLNRKEPPLTLKEVEQHFHENKGNLEVRIILTPQSVSEYTNTVKRLRMLADKYELPNWIENVP